MLPTPLRPPRNVAREAWARRAAQKVDEFRTLLDFLSNRRLAVVVEIGTDKGGTLYAWCQVAEPAAVIVSVDLPGGRYGRYSVTESRRLRRYARGKQELYFVRGDSHDPSTRKKLERILAGREIDFLFIDGDHSLAGVRSDFKSYSSFVRQGGVIAFHDILPHHPDAGSQVDLFWDEVKNNFEHHEFKAESKRSHQWGGIGALVFTK